MPSRTSRSSPLGALAFDERRPLPWWRTAVIYQIHPRSFADTTGSGSGHLNGVRAHLDHLSWLGVDALWLSPIYRSAMVDAGYDVVDHCGIDPIRR